MREGEREGGDEGGREGGREGGEGGREGGREGRREGRRCNAPLEDHVEILFKLLQLSQFQRAPLPDP